MFIAAVSRSDLLQGICTHTVFARGLPSEVVLREDTNITAIFNEVVRNNGIVRPPDYLISDSEDDEQKANLRKIFCSGWLHTEIVAGIDGVVYTFSSPLHKRCIDWVTTGSPIGSSITHSKLSEFALAVIQKILPQNLKRNMGPQQQSNADHQYA